MDTLPFYKRDYRLVQQRRIEMEEVNFFVDWNYFNWHTHFTMYNIFIVLRIVKNKRRERKGKEMLLLRALRTRFFSSIQIEIKL